MAEVRSRLREEVETAALAELERAGPNGLRRAALVRRFSGRGAGRSTLFRWIDELINSGRAGEHLARRVKVAAANRAYRSPDSAADAARDAARALPAMVTVE